MIIASADVTRRGLDSPWWLGNFSNDDGNEHVRKAIGLISKTTILDAQRTFLCISLPSLHNYDVKMRNISVNGGVKQATTNFFFPFQTWVRSSSPLQEKKTFNSREINPHLTYRKIPKMSPGAYIFQRPFLRGLYTEGSLRFKIS